MSLRHGGNQSIWLAKIASCVCRIINYDARQRIFVNVGKRGFMMEINPQDLEKILPV